MYVRNLVKHIFKFADKSTWLFTNLICNDYYYCTKQQSDKILIIVDSHLQCNYNAIKL